MNISKNNVIKCHIKGTLWALVITLACVLLLALFIKMMGLTSSTIGVISQIIKVISIFIGVLIAIRCAERHAWLHGAILGLLYTVLAFFIFSIIDNNFSITSGFIFEALFAIAIGMTSAFLIRMRSKNG